MLTPAHCDLFCQPFFQFAQLKQYCPERIEPLKSAYKSAWHDWRATVLQVACSLPATFAAPHIERWCNGWQMRAHFFAYFKYAEYAHSAAILSVILNRKRLTVALDWHAYRAQHSAYTLTDYHQWLDLLDEKTFGDFEIWRGSDDEYGEHGSLDDFLAGKLILQNDADFFRIGRHLSRNDLANADCAAFIQTSIARLLPLYERIHDTASGSPNPPTQAT